MANGNGKMSGNSAVVLECLLILAGFGIFAAIKDKESLLMAIIVAIVGVLNNAAGVKSGSLAGKLPEQASAPQSGQTGETKTESTVSTLPAAQPKP